jgi:hypothetical protein
MAGKFSMEMYYEMEHSKCLKNCEVSFDDAGAGTTVPC